MQQHEQAWKTRGSGEKPGTQGHPVCDPFKTGPGQVDPQTEGRSGQRPEQANPQRADSGLPGTWVWMLASEGSQVQD